MCVVLDFGVGSCTSEDFVLLQPQLPFAVNTVLRRLFLLEDINLVSWLTYTNRGSNI